MGTEQYGSRYWGVGLPDGKIVNLMADWIVVTDAGALVAIREAEDGQRHVNAAFAPERWTHCWAAALFDGEPIAVEHWEGVVER